MVKKPVLPLVLLACTMALAACDTTPSSVGVLMTQVASACKAGDKNALRACYATEGVTSEQIDQQLGSWDAYLDNKGDPTYGWTLSGITYVSMADAPNNKSILPDTITMAQGGSTGGLKVTPNIKVIGFLLVMFKQPNGTEGGATEPIGIASDGTAKFAIENVQQ
ncbi:MAG: hypothetical protein LV481_04540 [Methylacidiphilales bacterium]|nr:hypothetical protein [Candidatus Methylacidiphilales bacterium]